MSTSTLNIVESAPTLDVAEERKEFGKYDRERSFRLSRTVGIAFTLISFGALLILLVRMVFRLTDAPTFDLVFAIALLISMVFYIVGVWLTNVQHEALAGACVVAGTVLTLVTFQIDWENLNGLDPVVMGLFASPVVIVAMGGVLGNYPIMFAFNGVCTVNAVLICFLLPGHQSTSFSHALIAFILVVLVQWTAALFYVMASGTYLDTLSDIGDFRIAIERAKKLDELKDQFITNANHELRNPIMALYTYIYTVRMAGNSLTDDQRLAMLDQALAMGDRVQALLESILDVRRIDQGVPEFTPVSVNLREAITNAAGLVDVQNTQDTDRSLQLRMAPDLAIWGDPVLLQEIITNLLSNAIKYSAPNTPIEITGRLLKDTHPTGHNTRPVTSTMVQIQVCDHGLGIPREEATFLFQRFVRLPRDLASTVSGNGLGLYLCRILATAMSGRISVESTGIPGEGSTFILELPAPPISG